MNKNYFYEIVFSRLALVIFVIVMLVIVGVLKQATPVATVLSSLDSYQKLILPNNQIIIAEVVATHEQRLEGLSGRDSLAKNFAMLFIFDKEDYHSFWMPDMNFALDIIWLDESYKVVDIAENVQPMPEYDLDDLPRYINQSPARYVLEVNAGFSNRNELNKGDLIRLT